jgi:hypothetical protein
MQHSYHQAGFDISRVTYTQEHDGALVPDMDHLQAGDLILFRDGSGDVHHVGMYVGDHKFIHAPHTGDVIKVSDLREPYYQQQFYMGRRIAPDAGGAAAAFAAAPAGGVPAAAPAVAGAVPVPGAAAAVVQPAVPAAAVVQPDAPVAPQTGGSGR